jgi:AraC-like DNA-binding protein
MPNLNEISKTHLQMLERETWDNKLTCALTDKQLTMLTNEMSGELKIYSFTLVTKGHIILDNGGGEMIFTPDEMFVFYPGSPIYIHETSDDYKGICLIIDEQMAHDSQAFRNLIKASVIPLSNYGNSKVTLLPDDAQRLQSLMLLIRQYIMQPLSLKREILEHLYSVFINDLISIQSFEKTRLSISRQSEEIFVSFYTLLTSNYLEHRDLKFYADSLFITTTYLSRIVKQITGRTVMECINELLAMEATRLLKSTAFTVEQIADQLHFATSASFDKFYKRMRGTTPLSVRHNQ